MAKFKVHGGRRLSGQIEVLGAKNLALKLIAASLLCDGITTIKNVPDILDIRKMLDLMKSIGARVEFSRNIVEIDTKNIISFSPDRELVRHFRGSIVLIGPLLSRFGQSVISQPGGCLIGARPIDTHLNALVQLGVKYQLKGDTYHLTINPQQSDDSTVTLNQLSVTATETIILASVISKHTTHLRVAACEPEIGELIDFLNKMGAKISGRDTHFLKIKGVTKLKPVEFTVIPDRIEAATLAIIGALTKGDILIKKIIPRHLDIFWQKLRAASVNFEFLNHSGAYCDLSIKKSAQLKAVNIDTRTYPGFPTDLQAPFAVLMTQSNGVSQIFETLYEGRFNYLKELASMGASVSIQSPNNFIISGPTPLYGKEIKSLDIRGGAAVLIAALIGNGTSLINGIEMIDRGYENLDQRLNSIGAKIERT